MTMQTEVQIISTEKKLRDLFFDLQSTFFECKCIVSTSNGKVGFGELKIELEEGGFLKSPHIFIEFYSNDRTEEKFKISIGSSSFIHLNLAHIYRHGDSIAIKGF